MEGLHTQQELSPSFWCFFLKHEHTDKDHQTLEESFSCEIQTAGIKHSENKDNLGRKGEEPPSEQV